MKITHPDAVPYREVDWTGEYPPEYTHGQVPAHVAIIMDGNGRWANKQGLTRTQGHAAGEEVLLDVVAGALQAGVKQLSVYAFSTENWKRDPAEVRFLMGFNRKVLHRRRDQLNAWGVRIRWAGRRPKLWRSVIDELERAQEMTKHNTRLTLTMCINYGGKLEIVDAVREIAEEVRAGRLKPSGVTERVLDARMYQPDMPPVDLYIRSSGEQRISNFLTWQGAYAEMVFLDTLWPDFSRSRALACDRHLLGTRAAFWRRRRCSGGGDKAMTGFTVAEETPSVHELVQLYDSVGWSAYTRDPEVLAASVSGSSLVVAARAEREGCARGFGSHAVGRAHRRIPAGHSGRSGLARLGCRASADGCGAGTPRECSADRAAHRYRIGAASVL